MEVWSTKFADGKGK